MDPSFVPRSRGGSGGAQSPQQCKRIVERIGIQFVLIFDSMSSKICLPKAFKKQLYIFQNLDQSVAKMVQNRGLEGVWGAFGALLGVTWLRGPCGPLPGCLLGSSWAALEASWAPLGRLLNRLWHQVGASWRLLEATRKRLGRIFAP